MFLCMKPNVYIETLDVLTFVSPILFMFLSTSDFIDSTFSALEKH